MGRLVPEHIDGDVKVTVDIPTEGLMALSDKVADNMTRVVVTFTVCSIVRHIIRK